MEILPRNLETGALAARERLAAAARSAAAEPGRPSGAEAGRRMAAAARAAIFADALLGAMRARIEEFRTALK
jgi:hypothetical protein